MSQCVSETEETVSKALTSRQSRAIVALLGGAGISEVSRAAGTSERTIWRWLADEEFNRALQEAQAAAFATGAAALAGLLMASIDTLEELLDNKDASDTVRLRCALAILELVPRYHETTVLERRMAAIERRVFDGESKD